MTALALQFDLPWANGAGEDAGDRRPRLVPVPGGGRSLEEVIIAAWEAVAGSRAAACPVCSGAMEPVAVVSGRGAPRLTGRCRSCHSELT